MIMTMKMVITTLRECIADDPKYDMMSPRLKHQIRSAPDR
jgi:hypothetical protein